MFRETLARPVDDWEATNGTTSREVWVWLYGLNAGALLAAYSHRLGGPHSLTASQTQRKPLFEASSP